MKARSLGLLDYLGALALELSGKPVRRLSEYDSPPLGPSDIPEHPEVRLGPNSQRNTWLAVGRVPSPVPLTMPNELTHYLGKEYDDTEIPPVAPEDLDAVAAERGDDPDLLRKVLTDWVSDRWEPWAERARRVKATRKLYQRLYDLRLQLQRDSASHELVWGHGVLVWSTSGAVVEHPLVLTAVMIDLDPDTGVISISPEGAPGLETEPLQGLDIPGFDGIAALRERLRGAPPDPWAPEGLAEVYRQMLVPLGLDAQLVDGPKPVAMARPVLVDTWVAFVRPRPKQHQRFYRELREVLANADVLPEALATILTDENTVRAVSGEHRDDGSGGWERVGERLLMPLPTNDEQERIARQLATSRGVTVQGPPGTGKSHTIVNLISHLVAHGKRVLVTAHNEQALNVLRDKVPSELRDLAISVVGSNRAAMGTLNTSVQSILGAQADITDVEAEAEAIERLGRELDQARAGVRLLEAHLVDVLRSEAEEFTVPGGTAKAPDVATWLNQTAPTLGHIADRITADQPAPLTVAELAELYRLASDVPADDATGARTHLPSADQLPTAGALAADHETLFGLRDDLADLEARGISMDGVDSLGAGGLHRLLTEVNDAITELTDLDEAWLTAVRDQMAQSAELAGFWREQAEDLVTSSRTLLELRRETVGRTVALPTGDPRTQVDLLTELRQRFTAGKGVPRLGARALRAFFEATRLDGMELRTVADTDVVAAAVREAVARRSAAARFGQLADTLTSAPAVQSMDADLPSFPALFEATTGRLRRAVHWESATCGELVERLRVVLPDAPARPDVGWLSEVTAVLAAAISRDAEQKVTARLCRLRDDLETGQSATSASPLWGVLRDALDRRDFGTWTDTINEAQRLTALRPLLDRRDELAGRLRSVAPLWTDRILSSGGDVSRCGDPAELADLWRWRQADTWLIDLHLHGDVEQLRRQMAEESERVRRMALDLAARSARLGVRRNLRDDTRRSLVAWTQSIAKVGRNRGTSSAKWEAQARAELPAAMSAVPVWIMPIHQVFRSFDPRRTDLFDVVIVDESSQCDMLSLGVLGLGRKVVIVGDDKQISPLAVGVKQSRVSQLIETYLPDLPHRALLDVQSSMYDTAARAFGAVVLLREHFRCVPDIIGFSNRFYDNKILPLREASDRSIGPAVRPVRVAEGVRSHNQYGDVNEPEARALVDQLLACHRDPNYRDRTFGVVTLLGTGQGRLIEQLLIRALGVDDYEKRRLRVGDPYHFQGDERDVIFMSLVADNHNRYAAVRRYEQQRINVAASRARDQLWIFHTVDHTRLHPDDVRRLLLDYAYGINDGRAQVKDLEERCDSDFERAVLRELLSRGYDVRVQHPVGNFRIDLVVNGVSGRLAVECDGDRFHGPEQWEADIRRQRVLERLGWEFFRIRGSAFYRNPNAALAPLWTRLGELGIHSNQTGRQGRPGDPHTPSTPNDPHHGSTATTEPDPQPVPEPEPVSVAEPAPDPQRAPEPAPEPGPEREPEPVPSETKPNPAAEAESRSAPGPTVPANATRVAPVVAIAPVVVPPPSQPTPTVNPPAATEVLAQLARLVGAPQKRATTTAGRSIPVPVGYRSVGWIRPAEASAVLRALATHTDQEVPATDRDIASVIRYFPPSSAEAKKARANAVVTRMRATGPRWVAWIRSYEAEALVRAAEIGQDVSVEDESGRHRGLVTYFPPDSEAATTYRSVVRLLRTRPSRQVER